MAHENFDTGSEKSKKVSGDNYLSPSILPDSSHDIDSYVYDSSVASDEVIQGKSTSEHDERLAESIKNFLLTAIPYIISTGVTSGGNFLTAKILSLGGQTDLAASGLITSVLLIQQGFLYSPNYAVGILSAEGVGQNNIELTNASIQHGMTVSTMSSIPMILSSAFVGPILTSIGQESDIADVAQDYFNGYLWGIYADVFLIATQQHALATGHQNALLASTIFEKVFNISLGYCLMEGKLGLPEMGPYGVGLSASIAALTTFTGLNAYLIARKKISVPDILNLKKAYTERLSVLTKLLKFGAPISIQVGVELAILALMMQMSGLLGEDELIAAEVALQYYGFILVPVIGASQAAGVLISSKMGSDLPKEANRYANIAYTGVIIPQTIAIAMCLAYKPLTDFFLNSPDGEPSDQDEILQQVLAIFIINAFAISFDYTRNVSIGALRGLFDTAVPMGVNTTLSILNLAGSYLAGITLGYGNIGIYSVKALSIAGIAAILTPRWILKIRKQLNKDIQANEKDLLVKVEEYDEGTDDFAPLEESSKLSSNYNTFWNKKSANKHSSNFQVDEEKKPKSLCNLL